jgi:hypothetical protein
MFASRACFLAPLLALAACVESTPIATGPEGVPAHSITCHISKEDCYAKASELCPEGYVLNDSASLAVVYSGNASSGAMLGVPGSYRGELLVTCKSALPAPAAPEGRADAQTCEAAERYSADFGEFWQKWRASTVHAAPQEEKVDREAFLEVCREMSPSLQRCMHERYRAAHPKPCKSLFASVAAEKRTRIDGLFFDLDEAAPREPQ